MISCCLVVLNFNGQSHLKDCLDSAFLAVRAFADNCPVVVVDNHSTEDDVQYLRSNYPQVEIIIAKKNGYLFSLNEAVALRKEEIVFLLNNDVRFDPDFMAPLLGHFEDAKVFAVSCKTMDWEGTRVITAKRYGYFKKMWFYRKWDTNVSQAVLTLDFCGGASAVRRTTFLELGGFDRLFYPGYFEDTDLSYRAWKQGWKIIYEPRSVIYHKISASFNKEYGHERAARLICRNEILFTLKNCGNLFFAISYLFLLPFRALRSLFSGNLTQAFGIFNSLPKIPLALIKRFGGARTNVCKESTFLPEIAGQ